MHHHHIIIILIFSLSTDFYVTIFQILNIGINAINILLQIVQIIHITYQTLIFYPISCGSVPLSTGYAAEFDKSLTAMAAKE